MRFMDQAVQDAKDGTIPVVFMREDHGDWVVAFRVVDFPRAVQEFWYRSSEPTTHPTPSREEQSHSE
tara:strand:+ start:284 stop:484 length:201 start_codon:yes stop_codon:yes gene_type:complete